MGKPVQIRGRCGECGGQKKLFRSCRLCSNCHRSEAVRRKHGVKPRGRFQAGTAAARLAACRAGLVARYARAARAGRPIPYVVANGE